MFDLQIFIFLAGMALVSIVLTAFDMGEIALFIAGAGVCICVAILIMNSLGNNNLSPTK